MAFTELISVGRITDLVTDVIYALPQKRVLMFCPTAGAQFDLSNDDAMAVHIGPLTLVEGTYELSGAFIRVTSQGGAKIILKGT